MFIRNQIYRTVALVSILLLCSTCLQKNATHSPLPAEFQPLLQDIDNLKISMLDYLDHGGPFYTKTHVNQCVDILHAFLHEMNRADTREAALDQVRLTVLALNELNANCGGSLIETDQREQIAILIITAGYLKGFNAQDEDTTELWREW